MDAENFQRAEGQVLNSCFYSRSTPVKNREQTTARTTQKGGISAALKVILLLWFHGSFIVRYARENFVISFVNGLILSGFVCNMFTKK